MLYLALTSTSTSSTMAPTWFGFGATVLFAAGIGLHPGVEGETLNTFVERFWLWQQHLAPDYYSTVSGINFTSDEVEDFSQQGYLLRKNNATKLLSELGAISKVAFSDEDHLTYDLVEHSLETLISGYEFRFYGPANPVGPNDNPMWRWMGLVSSTLNANTHASLQRLLSWYSKLPQQLADLMSNMNQSISRGTSNHKASMAGVLDVFNSELDKGVNGSYFLTPYLLVNLNQVPGLDAAARNYLKTAGETIVQDKVYPAWEQFRDFVRDVYANNLRSGEGVSSVPGGEDYYAECLRWHLTTDDSPDHVHATGLEEVNRIKALMENEVASYGFSGTVHEFIDQLNKDPNSFHVNSTYLLEAYSNIIAKTRLRLPEILKHITQTPCLVEEHPNPNAPSGMYSSPSIDGVRPGRFLVNAHDMRTNPKFDMPALTMHEAEPGHHTQIAYTVENEKFPLFRRLQYYYLYAVPFTWPSYSSYVEGWALYAEEVADEIDAYTEDYSKLGKLNSEIFRACRLVVDTGLHHKGWTKQQAIDYMLKHTVFDETTITNEINRYISWPGQALAYKVGELKIKALREVGESTLGDRFDKREFHDQILKLGPVPLHILETRIQGWIDSLNKETSSASLLMNDNLLMLPLLMMLQFVTSW